MPEDELDYLREPANDDMPEDELDDLREPGNDDMPEDELDDLTADSKGGSKESITEKIYKINKEDKAPKCLKDGDVMNENCLDKASKRNAMRNRNRIWYTRRIPYVLHSSLSTGGRKAIHVAIQDFHRSTCIKFKEVKTSYPHHYIRFRRGHGCWSWIGKTRRRYQDISIGYGCASKGIVIHEIMHALGFFHEQSRYDRDDYIKINWKNIRRSEWRQFRKMSKAYVTALHLPYDYDGVMHYGAYAFAINTKEKTIVRKYVGGRIGQRRGFSPTDILQINRLYSCKSPPGATWSDWSRWSSCINIGKGQIEQSQRFCMSSDLKRCYGAGRRRVQIRRRACGKKPLNCKKSKLGDEYRGEISVTKTGLPCQMWDSQTPHRHTRTSKNFKNAGLLRNYCRNPDGEPEGPWCYTTSKDKRWEYCDVKMCKAPNCKKTKYGTEYRGDISVSKSGLTCLFWDKLPKTYTRSSKNFKHSGLSGNNYCRNPGMDYRGPWCYVTSKDKIWESCDIKWCKGYPKTEP